MVASVNVIYSLCSLNLNPNEYFFPLAEGRLLGTKVLCSLC
jgi:hypothetical protein